ncbi:hypothetical protein VTJ83DRAFT_7018 [Remersonia thermophila]|uniref:F-box domain-containing protein n=1 Tax=Remersonia thermophila TaxID=72144 RepID=A0ABR4D2F2_9PEZI
MAQFLATIPLPAEVLHLIMRELDPIALIALSQTSREWRALIRPNRHDFEQRLLALELHPHHGGLVPYWDDHKQRLAPSWDSPEWKTAKYACCGCMKLRTHMMFDNHAILRRRWRKPYAGCVEFDKALRTDWEPFEPALRWQHIQERAQKERQDRQAWAAVAAWREEYRLANPPEHNFIAVDLPPTDQEKEALRHLVGANRQRRRCVECQRKAGRWKHQDASSADGKVKPIVAKSRSKTFKVVWERWVPGLFDEHPGVFPLYWRSLNNYRNGIYASLYVAWCPRCETWKEYAAFRDWHPYNNGEGLTGERREFACVQCALEEQAEPRRVVEELCDQLRHLLDLEGAEHRLGFGWRFISQDLQAHPRDRGIRAEVLEGVRFRADSASQSPVINESTLPDLRRRVVRYRQYMYNEADKETRDRQVMSWFKMWLDEYELLEDAYFLVKRLHDKLRTGHLNFILDYLKTQDPYRLQSGVWW